MFSVYKSFFFNFILFNNHFFSFCGIFRLFQDARASVRTGSYAPVIGSVLKVTSRICVQRLYSITHPGYSYVLLGALYSCSAAVFRVLQADLDSLKSIAILGIIHGTVEVVERSTMVVIDHICHLVWKRTSTPWGSFHTPRRERLMADIAIMSMLSESAAIVSVNGFLYLYQFLYLQNNSLLTLLQSFAITTSVQLVIEWFFTSLSIAIETPLSKYCCHGCLAKTMEKTHFNCSYMCRAPCRVV